MQKHWALYWEKYELAGYMVDHGHHMLQVVPNKLAAAILVQPSPAASAPFQVILLSNKASIITDKKC